MGWQNVSPSGKMEPSAKQEAGIEEVMLRKSIFITVALLAGLLAVLFVHVDSFPQLSTYGVSVGTNTHYCSLDLVSGHLTASCESAS
jgi:hypothetical protein